MYRIIPNYRKAKDFYEAVEPKIHAAISEVLMNGRFPIQKDKDEDIEYEFQVPQNHYIRVFLQKYAVGDNLRNLILAEGDDFLNIAKEVDRNDRKNIKSYSRRLRYIKEPRVDFNATMYYIFVLNGYEKIKKEKFVEDLGLHICPYCGRSYIHSIERNSKKDPNMTFSAKPQIDHFIPKAQFPFFAVSYFNLIPSCSFCNVDLKHENSPIGPDDIKKSAKLHDMSVMHPYNFDESKIRYSFRLIGLDKTLAESYKVESDFGGYDGYKDIFGLDQLYAKHNDLVRDDIIKTFPYISSLQTLYEKGFNISPAFIKYYIRSILGFEPNPKNDKNMILSKFHRDIFKQISEITGYPII